MARNPFTAPAARLDIAPTPRVFLPLLVALVGGVASWIVALRLSGWSWEHFWLPMMKAGFSPPFVVREVLPFILVQGLFGTAMAFLSARPWWVPCPALLIGIALWVVVSALMVPFQGMAFALGIFQRDIFWVAIVAGSAAFLLTSRLRRRP